jgi:hypothetical protein
VPANQRFGREFIVRQDAIDKFVVTVVRELLFASLAHAAFQSKEEKM